MAIYRVKYQSMTASYGPAFIEADSPEEAKRKFGRGVFSPGELAVCATAVEVSANEMRAALAAKED